MSDANANAGASSAGDTTLDNVADYDEMIETLDVAIEEAKRKVESGRVYDADNEKVRIKWIRALAYAVKVRRQVVQDRDLEELAEEIEELKQLQEQRR